MNIITGATGLTHVTSNNDGEFNQAIFGDSLVVLKNGNKLDAEITTNNLITVKDGDLVFQGRHALIEPGTTDTITISTGTVDMKRNDLIVARYKLDSSTGYESLTLAVIEGTETSGTASDPSYTTGVIRTGATLAEFPLYRVKIDGINITDLEKLFTPIDNIIDGSSADKISYDNTESGMDATNVQDAIDECNENLTNYVPIYNPSDDYFYIGDKKWKKANLLELLVFDNSEGGFSQGYAFGTRVSCDGYSLPSSASITTSNALIYIKGTGSANGEMRTITPIIDLSQYSTLHAVVGGTEYKISTNGASSAYLKIGLVTWGGNYTTAHIGLGSGSATTGSSSAELDVCKQELYLSSSSMSAQTTITKIWFD